LLCTAQFVAVLDANALLVALPLIGRELSLSGGALQWVITGYGVVYAGCLLAAGRTADAWGRRRVFMAGLGLFTAASLTCGAAPSAEVLIGARVVQGLGAALLAPAALAMLPEGDRPVAIWTATAAIGGASGLLFGGVLAGALGWRWIFLINVPVGLVALALAQRLLRESRGEEVAPAWRGPLTATVGLAALVFGLAEHHWPIAAIALVALVLLGRRPVTPAVLGAVLTAALLTAATSGGAVLATLHLQDDLDLNPLQAGLRLLPLSIAVVAGSTVAGRRPIPIPAGLALVAAGSALAPLDLTAWAVLAGFGLGSASVAATRLGMRDAREPGTVAGLLSTAAQVGTAIGVAALVGLPDQGFALAAALTAAGAGLARWTPRGVLRRLESAPR
jgi:MFS family permease